MPSSHMWIRTECKRSRYEIEGVLIPFLGEEFNPLLYEAQNLFVGRIWRQRASHDSSVLLPETA
jgi:hypothetical protein